MGRGIVPETAESRKILHLRGNPLQIQTCNISLILGKRLEFLFRLPDQPAFRVADRKHSHLIAVFHGSLPHSPHLADRIKRDNPERQDRNQKQCA